MSEVAKFRVVGFRTVEPRPDGTLRRNSHFVSVEVDGVVHDVGVRRESGRAKLPQGLISHPQGEAIKKAAVQALLDDMLARIKRAMAERQLRAEAQGLKMPEGPGGGYQSRDPT
jgi:hypothetical protein